MSARGASTGRAFGRAFRSPGALDVGAALALTAWYYRYGLADLGGRLYDTFDQKLVIYLLEWQYHSCFGSGHLGTIFHPNMLFPNANVLAWSETFLGFLPVYAVFRSFTSNPVLALNCVALVSVFAAALGLLRLGRELTGRLAWVAATVGAVGLCAASQEGHFQMKALALFVWGLFLVVRVVHGSRWALPAFVVVTVWLFLSSLYLAVMFAVLLAFALIACAVRGRGAFVRWAAGAVRRSSRAGLAAAVLLSSAPLLWVGSHYLAVKRQFGGYPPDESLPFSARLGSLLDSSPSSVLYPTLYWDWGSHETRLFFGAAVWAAVLLLALRWRRSELAPPDRALVALFGLGALIAIVLAFGPYQRDALAHGVRISMPGRFLARVFPGYSAVRTSGRFGELAAVFLGILAEVGVRNGLAAVRVATSRARVLYAGVGAVFLLDQSTVLRPAEIDLFPRRAVYEGIRARTPDDAVVLELPVTRGDHFATLAWWQDQMVGSTLHWRRIPVGYTGHPSSFLEGIIDSYRSLESGAASPERFVDELAGRGITHLVVDDALVPDRVRTRLRATLATASCGTPLAAHVTLHALRAPAGR